MKIRVSIIGVPNSMESHAVAFNEQVSAEKLLAVLQKTYKEQHGYALPKDLSLLINGRNALSLPDRLQTKLRDGDEVILTVQVQGG